MAGGPHPSKAFAPSPFYDVAPVWATALQAVSPIGRTQTPAVYYYPPPFLLDTVSSAAPLPTPCAYPERARTDEEKAHRYIHNFVRIREFCRIRTFDVTIVNEPLNIEEWRTARWGNYEPPRLGPSSRSSENSTCRRGVRRQEERWRITRLFGIIAHFPSYRRNDTETYKLPAPRPAHTHV